VFQPFGGFADNVVLKEGYAVPHAEPGIGIELRAKMFDEMRKSLGLT